MDEKDNLPSDAENSGLAPKSPDDREPSSPPPPPDEKKVEGDPSEQPS